MPWSLTSSHHGIELILDEAGQTVGQVEYDPRFREWNASACPERFATRASLPAVFGGQFELRFEARPDLLRFFGIPFLGEAAADGRALARRAAA